MSAVQAVAVVVSIGVIAVSGFYIAVGLHHSGLVEQWLLPLFAAAGISTAGLRPADAGRRA